MIHFAHWKEEAIVQKQQEELKACHIPNIFDLEFLGGYIYLVEPDSEKMSRVCRVEMIPALITELEYLKDAIERDGIIIDSDYQRMKDDYWHEQHAEQEASND